VDRLALTWLTFVAYVGALRRVPRLADAVTGFVLVALGLHLAGTRR